jgi:alanyl-tRNA synthetase
MFTELMEEQKERSRRTNIVSFLKEYGVKEDDIAKDEGIESVFVGYDFEEYESTIYGFGPNVVLIHETPFYAESGGQVGDTGIILGKDFTFVVEDTKRDGPLVLHKGKPEASYDFESIRGLSVRASIDVCRRGSIMRNHTATHLVHAALRQILGTHVHQAGSLVAPDYLRFDFAHFAKVSEAELADIESLVNEKINENIKLNHYRNIPFEEAKNTGALMFFGDKYGDRVNVVEFSEFSREFCGGTHVKSTAEIGYFKFRSEGSVASGIRRIEAVTAGHALELLRLQDRNAAERIDYAEQQLQQVMDLQGQLGKEAANDAVSSLRKKLETLKSSPKTPERLTLDLQEQFRRLERRGYDIESLVLEIAEIRRTLEKEISKQRLQSLSGLIETLVQRATVMNGLKVVSSRVDASTLEELKALGDTLRVKLGSGVGLLASVIDDKVSLVCVVTDDLVSSKRLKAGTVVEAVAKIVGGGGGGKAHLATAGGKDVSKLDDALRSTESVVKSLLKN